MIKRTKVLQSLHRRFGQACCNLKTDSGRVFIKYKRRLELIRQLPFWVLPGRKAELQLRARMRYSRDARRVDDERFARMVMDGDMQVLI